MTNRVLLSVADGLKVSVPGVDVLTAGVKDLNFSSGSHSFPLVEKISFHMNTAWGDEQTAYFSRTYPNRPTVSVFWGGVTDPSGQTLANQKFLSLISFGSRGHYQFETYRAISQNYTLVRIRVYQDRITFQNWKSNQGGSDMTPFSGYFSIVVYGFYN